jgi:hypothetical protein
LPYGLNMSGGGPDLDGAAKRVNRRSTCLLHGLNRSGGGPDPDGPASVDGSVGGGTARVGEGGGDGSVRGASGPWV